MFEEDSALFLLSRWHSAQLFCQLNEYLFPEYYTGTSVENSFSNIFDKKSRMLILIESTTLSVFLYTISG